jgi:hypothetical protein
MGAFCGHQCLQLMGYVGREQGCQMVYLCTKNADFGIFRRPWNGNIWYFSWQF